MPRAGGKHDQDPKFIQSIGILEEEIEIAKTTRAKIEAARQKLKMVEA